MKTTKKKITTATKLKNLDFRLEITIKSLEELELLVSAQSSAVAKHEKKMRQLVNVVAKYTALVEGLDVALHNYKKKHSRQS